MLSIVEGRRCAALPVATLCPEAALEDGLEAVHKGLLTCVPIIFMVPIMQENSDVIINLR